MSQQTVQNNFFYHRVALQINSDHHSETKERDRDQVQTNQSRQANNFEVKEQNQLQEQYLVLHCPKVGRLSLSFFLLHYLHLAQWNKG